MCLVSVQSWSEAKAVELSGSEGGTWFCCSSTVWPWASYISFEPQFPHLQMGLITAGTSKILGRIIQNHLLQHIMLCLAPSQHTTNIVKLFWMILHAISLKHFYEWGRTNILLFVWLMKTLILKGVMSPTQSHNRWECLDCRHWSQIQGPLLWTVFTKWEWAGYCQKANLTAYNGHCPSRYSPKQSQIPSRRLLVEDRKLAPERCPRKVGFLWLPWAYPVSAPLPSLYFLSAPSTQNAHI